MKMLPFFKTSFLILSFLIAFSSCNKDSEDGGGDVGGGSLKAKVNGEMVNFGNVQASSAIGVIAITGEKDEMKITFILPADIQEGETQLSDNDVSHSAVLEIGDKAVLGNGVININSHNHNKNTLKATFHFSGTIITGDEEYNITDGSLDVNYEEAK